MIKVVCCDKKEIKVSVSFNKYKELFSKMLMHECKWILEHNYLEMTNAVVLHELIGYLRSAVERFPPSYKCRCHFRMRSHLNSFV